MQIQPIPVIGERDNAGQRNAQWLPEQDYSLRPGTRATSIAFDWDREASLNATLARLMTDYTSSFPDPTFANVFGHVKKSCTSGQDNRTTRRGLALGTKKTLAEHCEVTGLASGVDFTLVRHARFAQNFCVGYLRNRVIAGMIALPLGCVHRPILNIDETADTTLAALTDLLCDESELYELTVSRQLFFSRPGCELAQASRSPSKHCVITLSNFQSVSREYGDAFAAASLAHMRKAVPGLRNRRRDDGANWISTLFNLPERPPAKAQGRAPLDQTCGPQNHDHSDPQTGAANFKLPRQTPLCAVLATTLSIKDPSMSPWFFLFCQACVLSFGLLAGVFLAFSDFVMRALSLAPHTGGIEVMQIINREVFRYVFIALFIGMVPASVALTGYGLVTLQNPGSAWIATAGGLYLLAAFGVTILANVPMNEALAPMDPGAQQTQDYW